MSKSDAAIRVTDALLEGVEEIEGDSIIKDRVEDLIVALAEDLTGKYTPSSRVIEVAEDLMNALLDDDEEEEEEEEEELEEELED